MTFKEFKKQYGIDFYDKFGDTEVVFQKYDKRVWTFVPVDPDSELKEVCCDRRTKKIDNFEIIAGKTYTIRHLYPRHNHLRTCQWVHP